MLWVAKWAAVHCYGGFTSCRYPAALDVDVAGLSYFIYSNGSNVKCSPGMLHFWAEAASRCPQLEQETCPACRECRAELWPCLQLQSCPPLRLRSCAVAENTPASSNHVTSVVVPSVHLRATFPLQCPLINLLSYTLLRLGLAPKPQREESTCQEVSVYNEREVWMETTQLSHSSCDIGDAIASIPIPVRGRGILGGQMM